jgi:hypothetical protein
MSCHLIDDRISVLKGNRYYVDRGLRPTKPSLDAELRFRWCDNEVRARQEDCRLSRVEFDDLSAVTTRNGIHTVRNDQQWAF